MGEAVDLTCETAYCTASSRRLREEVVTEGTKKGSPVFFTVATGPSPNASRMVPLEPSTYPATVPSAA